ncbi:MAG: hypothetical protein AAFY56_12050 [Pseudomonadota bacterium]
MKLAKLKSKISRGMFRPRFAMAAPRMIGHAVIIKPRRRRQGKPIIDDPIRIDKRETWLHPGGGAYPIKSISAAREPNPSSRGRRAVALSSTAVHCHTSELLKAIIEQKNVARGDHDLTHINAIATDPRQC